MWTTLGWRDFVPIYRAHVCDGLYVFTFLLKKNKKTSLVMYFIDIITPGFPSRIVTMRTVISYETRQLRYGGSPVRMRARRTWKEELNTKTILFCFFFIFGKMFMFIVQKKMFSLIFFTIFFIIMTNAVVRDLPQWRCNLLCFVKRTACAINLF